MKKLFLGLIATLMFCFAGNAQNGSYTKSAMTVAVAAAKGTYTKGMPYKDWLKNQVGTTIPTKEEDKFLNDLFNYLATGANSETILKTYDGKSLMDLAFLSGKGGLKVITEATISNQNRWCIICLIKILIDTACTYLFNCNGPVVPTE